MQHFIFFILSVVFGAYIGGGVYQLKRGKSAHIEFAIAAFTLTVLLYAAASLSRG